MQRSRGPRSRTAPALTAMTALTCLLLAATADLAFGRTKACSQIRKCATRAVASPPPQTTLGPPSSSTGRFTVAVATAPTASATVGTQRGTLIAKPQPATSIDCPGYRLKDPTPLLFQLRTATPVRITYEITDRLTNARIDEVHFCLAQTAGFKTASGSPARRAKLPDGTLGHIGLLPSCPKPLPPAGVASAPCVESVSSVPDSHSTTHVDVILKVRVPTRTKGGASINGDPWGGG